MAGPYQRGLLRVMSFLCPFPVYSSNYTIFFFFSERLNHPFVYIRNIFFSTYLWVHTHLHTKPMVDIAEIQKHGNFRDVYENSSRNTLLKRSFTPSAVGFLEEERVLAGMVRADLQREWNVRWASRNE